MFYDSESMKDIVEISLNKEDWSPYLVIGEFFKKENASNQTLTSFLEQWRGIIRETLHDEDAGHPLNKGNVLVLIHKDNQKQFQKTVSSTLITSSETDTGLRSSIISLNKRHLHFLVSLI